MKTVLKLDNKTLFLVRHGLSTLNKRGYGRKKLTADLLPQGIIDAEKAAGYLKNIHDSHNFSSDIPRCKQTAEIISRITGKLFHYDKRLTEFYHETFTDFKKRIINFLEELPAVSESNIIICTHAAVVVAIKYLITEDKFIRMDLADEPLEGEIVILKRGGIIKKMR
ncbi:histidine phosphatase family protein [Candidatus Roizmanbacteria bacterium]|nr:histidine phosphatase family protein [Candidatus Roizmanbacteria bacterium]